MGQPTFCPLERSLIASRRIGDIQNPQGRRRRRRRSSRGGCQWLQVHRHGRRLPKRAVHRKHPQEPLLNSGAYS